MIVIFISIPDRAEEDKESEELDLTGLDETELDKVIQIFPFFSLCQQTHSPHKSPIIFYHTIWLYQLS